MLINFTNHPYGNWADDQKRAAEAAYGQVADMPFPQVDPQSSEEDIVKMAEMWVKRIAELQPDAVLCQGEMGLCFAAVKLLMKNGISVLYACSERVSRERNENGKVTKVSEFVFRKFRAYA